MCGGLQTAPGDDRRGGSSYGPPQDLNAGLDLALTIKYNKAKRTLGFIGVSLPTLEWNEKYGLGTRFSEHTVLVHEAL